MNAHSYPHLSPELRRLTGDALSLWGDAGERRQALLDVLDAWRHNDSVALVNTVRRVDRAVVEGLAAIGLPRATGVGIEAGAFGRRWIGRVTPEGMIQIDVERMAGHLAEGGHPDRGFHTWVHESIHARQPAASGRDAEYARWPGYEEGIAESLARFVTGTKAGMTAERPSYEYYVQAYRALAQVADLGAEELWRRLWQQAPGDVRAHFVSAVDSVRRAHGRPPLNTRQAAQQTLVGDRVFSERHYYDQPNAGVLTRLWESVFK
jgi:hypothetical protein